jgi:hypothetical protein
LSLDPSTFAALSSAAAVRSVGIVHRGEQWEVWVRVGQTLAESASHPIHTTPGERHHWSSIDAAYAFVRNQGYRGTVEVDDAIAAAGVGAGAALATTPEPLPAPRQVVPAVSGPPTPQGRDKTNTRSPLTLTTPPKKSTTTPARTTTGRPRPLSGPHRSTRPGTRPAPKDPQG